MSTQRHTSSPSRPRPVPSPASPPSSRGRSPVADSYSRAASTARLQSSPNTSSNAFNSRQASIAGPQAGDTEAPLAGAGDPAAATGPGQSALAAALHGTFGRSPPRFGTPSRLDSNPLRAKSPTAAGAAYVKSGPQSTYGSFDTRSTQAHHGAVPAPTENPEVVRRHLVQAGGTEETDDRMLPSHKPSTSSFRHGQGANTGGLGEDVFSSLQLQGGDMTREVYRWTEDAESQSVTGRRGKRSKSFDLSRPEPEGDDVDISSIKVPGGFRRNYLIRQAPSPSPGGREDAAALENGKHSAPTRPPPRLFTKSFLEFLTVYGHFAGEELEEDDEDIDQDGYYSSGFYDESGMFGRSSDEEDGDPGEGSALLIPSTPRRWVTKSKERGSVGDNTPLGAALLLLKSFVGTGVLFLPKAYSNGGMMFSNVVLLGVAMLSYHCFILLVNTRLKVTGSFGDIGGILYGKWLRVLILSSVALSQVGFVSAYIVFTSKNMQAFFLAVSDCDWGIDIKLIILIQLIIFLPLSLVRDIGKLGITALIADFFILLGLIYLYYYDILTLVRNHGIGDTIPFNPQDWTLFIGTAIFTFEGVGLIIPIQESMKKPSEFPPVLAGVMIIITVVFISMGALSYAAFGSATKTVILLNLPQDNRFVNSVQFLYSLAILLSTPLQLFPAIRIMENGLFTRSGKFNPYIKWKKNAFRFVLVVMCALIAWGGAGDLDKFVALVGSFACVPLVYVYPVSLPLLSESSLEMPYRTDTDMTYSPYYISEPLQPHDGNGSAISSCVSSGV